MDVKFNVTVNESTPVLTGFTKNHSLLVNFHRNNETSEYGFTFVNDKEYSTLSFTFNSALEIYCYFKYLKKDGKAKFVGYKHLKESEQIVDISNCSEFSIIIPRESNEDIRTLLTLTAIKAT